MAFIKHSTVGDYIDAEWAAGKEMSDFKLLCPTNENNYQCMPVDQYEDCNIARVPAHAAGVNPAYMGSEIQVHIREVCPCL